MNKQIDLGGGYMIELTPEYERRIIESLSETQELLDKKLSEPYDMQDTYRIEWLQGHIAKLQSWLA